MPTLSPRWLIAVIVALVLAGSGPFSLVAAQTPDAGTPTAGTPTAVNGHGIDVEDMDLSVDPAEDFYRFANGGWLDRTELGDAQPAYGVFDEIQEVTGAQLIEVMSDLTTDDRLVAGSDAWKVARFYEQGLDADARDAAGIDPIRPILQEIADIDGLDALAVYQQAASLYNLYGLVSLYVDQDLADSSRYAVYSVQPYLGLGSRDYYADDPDLEPIQSGYRDALAQMLVIGGTPEADAAGLAERVYDFEVLLAEQLYTPEESADYEAILENLSVEEIAEEVPFIDWDVYLAGLGLEDVDGIITTEGRSLETLDGLVRDTDLAVVQAYLASEVLFGYAPYLDDATYRVYFDFFGPTFSGVDTPRPVEDRVLQTIDGLYGDVIGQRYVESYFPPEAKARIEDLVDRIIAAFRTRLENNPWLSEDARTEALAKLDTLVVKVGYPDEFQTYGTYSIGRNYGETVVAGQRAFYERNFARYGTEVDRGEWGLTPQTVNAYYNATNNEIVFPAAILQAPFFDYRADAASNYGAIGVVIGHEITHAFDRSGSQFDSEGNLRDWYTEADVEAFTALNQRVIDQFGAIEVAPDLFIDGELTIGENTADLGGMQVSWDAMRIALEETGDPGEIDGFTQGQRFFIATASVWRTEIRPEALADQVQNDPHSPGIVRAVQPGRNMDQFYETFDIVEGDPTYLPEDERVVVW